MGSGTQYARVLLFMIYSLIFALDIHVLGIRQDVSPEYEFYVGSQRNRLYVWRISVVLPNTNVNRIDRPHRRQGNMSSDVKKSKVRRTIAHAYPAGIVVTTTAMDSSRKYVCPAPDG